MTDMDSSQQEAIDKITNWLNHRLKDPKEQPIFRLGGYAGSGKTTVITEVTKWCDNHSISYALATFAGKAADVLRRKGLQSAQTIHSLIYVPNKTAQEKVRELKTALMQDGLSIEKRRELLADLKVWRDKQFTLRTSLDGVDLLIVDEASMVSGQIANHLHSFGKPILAVGDPAQLPPVDMSPISKPLFYDQTPDAVLTGQHRFGVDGVLGDVATAARSNTPIPSQVIKTLGDVNVADFDVVLVHKNENRWKFIHAVRGAKGLPLDRPVPGDRITFWKNNREENVFNGGSVIVNQVAQGNPKASKHDAWECLVVTDTGEERTLLVDKRGFIDQEALKAAENRSDVIVASHSESLTVHKAQGSEWPRVLVADHPSIGWKRIPAEDKIRWRYTAVTRAQEELVLVDPQFGQHIPLPRNHKLP